MLVAAFTITTVGIVVGYSYKPYFPPDYCRCPFDLGLCVLVDYLATAYVTQGGVVRKDFGSQN